MASESAARFLRSEVARRVTLKRVPELRFHLDPAIRHGRRIDAILKDLGSNDSATSDESDASDESDESSES